MILSTVLIIIILCLHNKLPAKASKHLFPSKPPSYGSHEQAFPLRPRTHTLLYLPSVKASRRCSKAVELTGRGEKKRKASGETPS